MESDVKKCSLPTCEHFHHLAATIAQYQVRSKTCNVVLRDIKILSAHNDQPLVLLSLKGFPKMRNINKFSCSKLTIETLEGVKYVQS